LSKVLDVLDADEDYEDLVIAGLRVQLRAVASRSGASLASVLGPADDLVERLLAAVPSPSPLAAVVGPVYRPASLARVIGCSRQAISDMVKTRRLLALRTADSKVVIPAFQLGPDFKPLPGLEPVLRLLGDDIVDDWTLASWLTAPQDRLEGRSVVQHLRAGGNAAEVLVVAESARSRWSH
jgi:hypothetical protein